MGTDLLPWRSCVCVLLVFMKKGFAGSECDFDVLKLWKTNLRENPITAPPLLFDVDGDHYDDVLVPSFTGEVWGIHGENGHIVDNWPFYLEERAFHSGSLVYDVNHDGVLEFLLVTTDAEIVFVQTDNILLHGETIKLPPFRVKRKWHQEDPAHIKKMAGDVLQQAADDPRLPFSKKPSLDPTTSFSEFDSRFGRHADPLYSRHEMTSRPAGIDPDDNDYVFVDAHVLATPIITDTNGDGIFAELVVPVSYYFDPYRYGDVEELTRLNGLEAGELVDYVAGGVVVVDLDSGKVKGQRMLGITRGVDNQPGYLLATPTAVRLTPSEDLVIIVGSVMGELHVMEADSLREQQGFPLLVDSITAQVAVGDLFNGGKLDLLVGDRSGNLYCVDSKGKRVWERELDQPLPATVRLADVEGDGLLEVFVASRHGDVWVLNGQTGQDHTPSRYPVHLNSGVETSLLLVHLHNKKGGAGDGGQGQETLGVVVPTADSLYVVDASSGCVQAVPTDQHVMYELATGDIDPYSPGLELLGVGLDGMLLCYRLSGGKTQAMRQEEWSMDAMGSSLFTHKASSFYFELPLANSSQEIAGKTFALSLTLHSSNYQTSGAFSLVVSVGRKHVLWRETLQVRQRVTEFSLRVPTPPTPTHAFVTVLLCNQHMQCLSQSSNLRFNLHAEDHLKWFLSLPFLCLCATLLWLHREHSAQAGLPTTTSTRKDL